MRARRDVLIGVVALALLAPLTVLAGWPLDTLRFVAAAALILVLPGYALSALLFSGSSFAWQERVLFAVGLSLAVTVLGGLLLNLTPWGLQTESWLVWLSGVTVIAGSMALARSPLIAGSGIGSARLGKRAAGLVAMAAFVVVLALVQARAGAVLLSNADTVQFWLLNGEGTAANEVQLGLRSLEAGPTVYTLEVWSEEALLHEWPTITLAPGELWEATLRLPEGTPRPGVIEGLLFIAGQEDVYRRAVLR
ncbi:MAG: DUF1616 domain-containing protein [Chloroflexota bacterium]